MSNNDLLNIVKAKVQQLVEGADFYWDGGFMVFTRAYHLQRSYCCGSGCRHCPYEPQWVKGSTMLCGTGSVSDLPLTDEPNQRS